MDGMAVFRCGSLKPQEEDAGEARSIRTKQAIGETDGLTFASKQRGDAHDEQSGLPPGPPGLGIFIPPYLVKIVCASSSERLRFRYYHSTDGERDKVFLRQASPSASLAFCMAPPFL